MLKNEYYSDWTIINKFKDRVLTVDISQGKRSSCNNIIYEILLSNSAYRCFKILYSTNKGAPLKVPHNNFLFKPNATMNYHDSQWRNNKRNNLDSNSSFLQPHFRFIYIFKIIQIMIVKICIMLQYWYTS